MHAANSRGKQELEKLSKEAPLIYLVSNDIIDKQGRRIARLRSLSESIDDHLLRHIATSIRIGTGMLHFILDEAQSRDILSVHEVMKFLSNSCLIEKTRYPIVQRGLEAYFSDDFITTIHLLIPQFEEAIRNLVEMNGGSVMVQKGEFFSLKTFDHLLNDEIVRYVFGEDKALYFRVLFTDKLGWNMRNNVAHGMVDVDELLNKQNADQLLHAFLCVGMVRLVEA